MAGVAAGFALPVIADNRVAAVLDIDSTEPRGLDETDQAELEGVAQFVASRMRQINWQPMG